MSWLQNFFKRNIPVVKADDGEEELVDPQKVLREICAAKSRCVNLQKRLTTCNDRVNSTPESEEVCLEELVDFVHCVDRCVAKELFSKLK